MEVLKMKLKPIMNNDFSYDIKHLLHNYKIIEQEINIVNINS